MKPTLSEHFLKKIEAFLGRSQLDATAFGRLTMSDPSFVFDLRKGRSPSANTIDKVNRWMAAYRRKDQLGIYKARA